MATAAPSGRPIAAEHSVDVRLTPSDSATIAVTRGSRCVTIARATDRLSAIVFMDCTLCRRTAILCHPYGYESGQPSCLNTVRGGPFTVERVPSQPASVTAAA